jgi:adenylate kinase family enzyme
MKLESDINFLDALNQTTPQRIMIMGRPGSGKSTFSIKLQSMLNIPLYHLDKHFFEANWVQRNYQDFLNEQQYFVSQSSWIIDGNSSKSLEVRYSRADICLYFNFPRYLCYYRTIKRLFHKHPAIDDRAPGCKETVRWSLLEYMWGYEKRMRPILSQLKTNYPNVKLIELGSDQDVILFSENLLQVINQSDI